MIRFSYLVLLFINQNNRQNTTKHNNIIIREKVQASFLERERGVYLVFEMLLSSQRSWRQLPQHADKPHFSSFIICSSTVNPSHGLVSLSMIHGWESCKITGQRFVLCLIRVLYISFLPCFPKISWDRGRCLWQVSVQ